MTYKTSMERERERKRKREKSIISFPYFFKIDGDYFINKFVLKF